MTEENERAQESVGEAHGERPEPTPPGEPAPRNAEPKRSPLFGAIALAVVIVLAVTGILIASPHHRKPPPFIPEPGPGAFRGLGTWVDIFEQNVWANPEAAVQQMASHNVRTIYVESSNYSHDAGVIFPDQTARLIDAAHAAGMKVVAWYLPGLDNLDADLRRSMEAIHFTTPTGGGFDGFALDIEAMLVHNPVKRNQALLKLSQQVRDAVGPGYPLGAITPNPMRLQFEKGYWPDFPYAQISQLYDVIMPMDYFGAVAAASNKSGALHYTLSGIRLIRAGAVNPGVPIHVIGGLAEDVTGPELAGFLKAVDRGKAIGYSLYNFSTSGPADWAGLQAAVDAGLTVGVGESATPAAGSTGA